MRPGVAICAVVMTMALARTGLAGQAEKEPPRFNLSALVGILRPSDESSRTLYGGSHVPIAVQLECRLRSRLALFGGVQFVWADGRTVAEGAQRGDEDFALSFTTYSIRAGALVLTAKRGWTVFAGGGVNYSSYREEWTGAPISVSGGTYGLVAQAGARHLLTGPITLSGAVEYTYAPADSDASGGRIDLGGFSVSLGIGFRF